MNKKYTFLLVNLLIGTSVSFATKPIDSIGVENYKGKKLVLYKVEAKETYYSISKKYNINPNSVVSFNDNKTLQIGLVIKVPTEIPFTTTYTSNPNVSETNVLTEYIVVAKDNLNLIAEKFGTTVNEIKRINGLKSINLQIGQILKISGEPKEVVAKNPVQVEEKIPVKPIPIPIESTVPPIIKTVENTANTETLTYVVKPKDNLNLISEKFGTSVEQIKSLNNLSSNILSIGQILKVSGTSTTPQNTVATAPPVNQPVTSPPSKVESQKVVKEQISVPITVTEGDFEYTVLAGESIYSIAKKHGLTTYQIKTANKMTGNDVSVGQKLKIIGAKAVTETVNEEIETTSTNTIKDPSLKYPPSKYGIKKIEEKGTAVWITDQDLDASKMLALHRTAPVGTIINITNPMTNRTTFAKVVGKFTENETTKDVIIVMTKAVADAIGALDKRFFCNINYGAQENEQ